MKRLLTVLTIALLAVNADAGTAGFSSSRSSSSSISSSRPATSSSYSSPKSTSTTSGYVSKPAAQPIKQAPGTASKTVAIDKAQAKQAYQAYQGKTPEQKQTIVRNFYVNRNYNPPVYYNHFQPSYGAMDTIMMFYMLDHIMEPDYAKMAYANSSSQDMKLWREQAEREAQTNVELRAKLDALDKQVQAMNGQEVEVGYIPPEVLAQAKEEEGIHWGWLVLVTTIMCAGIGAILLRRWR